VTFKTERLPLAIYLHASQSLKLIGCEQSRPGKMRFVFDDPANRGSEYEFQFDRGSTVSATAIFASQKYLRRLMTQELKNQTNGKGNYLQRATAPSK
jgi:hypothetical protein